MFNIIKKYHNSLILLIIFLIIFEGLVIYIALPRPYWGDERHFVATIMTFGEEMNLNTLKHYKEMSPPLPFILYAYWGKIFGFELYKLRFFSILIAFITYLLFHYLLFRIFENGIIALLSSIFLIIHPYMIGLSIFVFTDMLAIMFLLFALYGIIKNNWIIYTLAAISTLLSRQYTIFFILASGIYYLLHFLRNKEEHISKKEALLMILANGLAIIPLLALFIFWKGASPESETKYIYINEAFTFHISFLILYISQLFIYLLPLILLSYKYIYNKKILISSLIVSSIYWFFPITPCKLAIEANVFTIGFFHRFLRIIFKNLFLEQIVFYLTLLFALPILYYILKDTYLKIKEEKFNFTFLLNLFILSFLIIMPFSYLCWEKYFLPILPFTIIRILLIRFPNIQLNYLHKGYTNE